MVARHLDPLLDRLVSGSITADEFMNLLEAALTQVHARLPS